MKLTIIVFLLLLTYLQLGYTQPAELKSNNIEWTTQSRNSSESMPCGGGDVGLNVWVENNEVLFYISKSGTFDENNAFLKLGRIRLKLIPNPFEGKEFKQELNLYDGNVNISGINGTLKANVTIWVDVFRPVIHVDVQSNKPLQAEACYESWRFEDRPLKGRENRANSYRWEPQGDVKTYKDLIVFKENDVLFYHRNRNEFSVFDVTVKQQGLDQAKEQMFDPLKNLVFGGVMRGKNMIAGPISNSKYINTNYTSHVLQSASPSRTHQVEIYLHTAQAETMEEWQSGLQQTVKNAENSEKSALKETREWWHQFWNRSFIFIQPENKDPKVQEWQIGRNYQLFRYQLGCNAYGKYPTKFNGGLFTFDPVFVDTAHNFTPDHRLWGGGTFTAQNQRLVYFPMIKSGDFDLMKPQFDFYLRALKNAELRSELSWGHKGACFTEQLENFGLPNCTEYGWKRPAGYDIGMEYNAWLEYEWDTVLEFCLMILEKERYTGNDISEYMPLIESCLIFFNEHYQYLAKKRGIKALDSNKHLVLYPGSGAETFKMAYNATSTIAALKTVIQRLLELPASYLNEQKRKDWTTMLTRIPPLTFREFSGYKTISPAITWERINNTETPQLYPVFPWGMYGVGKPDLEIAVNTWKYDTLALKFRSHKGWKQDNIWAARLGLANEAAELNILKLKDADKRFPTFWGPGFDWTPDHNWGGSGMIGLQEMLLQVDGKKIFLFPAWPKTWDVHFKLHAPYNTTIEGTLKNGKLESLLVVPETRKNDITNML